MDLTLAEVNERHSGILPAGATLKSDVLPEEKAKAPRRGRPPPKAGKDRWGMFNAFVDSAMRDLTRAETAVWLALFRDTKRETGLARTSQTDLARRSGCSVRAVQSAVPLLQEKGFLKVERRGRINAGPSTYRVTLPV